MHTLEASFNAFGLLFSHLLISTRFAFFFVFISDEKPSSTLISLILELFRAFRACVWRNSLWTFSTTFNFPFPSPGWKLILTRSQRRLYKRNIQQSVTPFVSPPWMRLLFDFLSIYFHISIWIHNRLYFSHRAPNINFKFFHFCLALNLKLLRVFHLPAELSIRFQITLLSDEDEGWRCKNAKENIASWKIPSIRRMKINREFCHGNDKT